MVPISAPCGPSRLTMQQLRLCLYSEYIYKRALVDLGGSLSREFHFEWNDI